MSEIDRLREENRELRQRIRKLTACPGCGGHPRGAHLCPGPPRQHGEAIGWCSRDTAGAGGEGMEFVG